MIRKMVFTSDDCSTGCIHRPDYAGRSQPPHAIGGWGRYRQVNVGGAGGIRFYVPDTDYAGLTSFPRDEVFIHPSGSEIWTEEIAVPDRSLSTGKAIRIDGWYQCSTVFDMEHYPHFGDRQIEEIAHISRNGGSGLLGERWRLETPIKSI